MSIKNVLVLLLISISIPIILLTVMYGTPSPCGILKKKMYADMREITSEQGAGGFLGAALAIKAIESNIDSLTPLECTRALVDYSNRSLLNAYDSAVSRSKNTYSEPIIVKPEWRITKETSPIDDSTNVFLYITITGNNDIRGWSGEATPSLALRCKEDKTKAWINAGVYLDPDYRTNDVTMTLRWDKTQAVKTKLSASTDRKAGFFKRQISTAKKMLGHKLLTVQLTPDNSGEQVTSFDLTGLPDKLPELRKACHW